MYDHDRYFTVTGDVFEGRGALGSNPEVVERAYRTWIEPGRAAAQPTLSEAPTAGADMDDKALLERMYASRRGDAIRALMAGDCSAQGGDRSACLEGAMLMARWALVNATGADGGDTDVKAIQFVAEWLVRNRLHFESSAEMDRLERWGSVEQYRDRPGFCWWVFSSVLDQALAGANFDRQKTLRRMADEGVLLPGSGRGFTRQKRFGDSRVYCVCVDNAALEAMLERSAGAPPSVAPSQGGGPC